MVHTASGMIQKRVLLVEDSPGDIRLIQEAIRESNLPVDLSVVMDGVQAINYLQKKEPYTAVSTPDLILLDLNLPKRGGRAVLKEIKEDTRLRKIPVVVLTISQADEDVLECYNLNANCYVMKPFGIEHNIQLMKDIMHFWFNVVTLSPKKELESGY